MVSVNKTVTIILDLRDAKSFQKAKQQLMRLDAMNKSGGIQLDAQKSTEGTSGQTMSDTQLREEVRRLQTRYVRPMLKELKTEPPHRKYPEDYPFDFTTDLQRRYVMSQLGGKNGGGYKRKGSISKFWRANVTLKNGKISLRIRNTKKESLYVYGKVGMGRSASSIRRYLKPMQPAHRITGWTPAYITVQKWMKRAKRDAKLRIKDFIQDKRYAK